MINKASEMLKKAAAAVEDRQGVYGPPTKNFKNIADLWNAWLAARYDDPNVPLLDASDVSVMSLLIKTARLAETPGHEDSWVDIAGYAGCGLQVQDSMVDAVRAAAGLSDECECPICKPTRGIITKSF
jgi:hypothetical protein